MCRLVQRKAFYDRSTLLSWRVPNIVDGLRSLVTRSVPPGLSVTGVLSGDTFAHGDRRCPAHDSLINDTLAHEDQRCSAQGQPGATRSEQLPCDGPVRRVPKSKDCPAAAPSARSRDGPVRGVGKSQGCPAAAPSLTCRADAEACPLPVVPPFPFPPEAEAISVPVVVSAKRACRASTEDDSPPGHRGRLRVLVENFAWPDRLFGVIVPRRRRWRTSTAFSGIGCLELSGMALERAVGRSLFQPVAAIERDAYARGVFLSHSPAVPCGSDILSWLPEDVKRRSLKMSGDRLKNMLLNDALTLDLRGRDVVPFAFGDFHIAGPPCIDFSPMGIGRRECGPSMPCFLTWARALRSQRPLVVVVENVQRFPVALLEAVFGDVYAIDWVVLEATDFGMHARRKRLYCVLTLRRVVKLDRPLGDLPEVVAAAGGVATSWESLFCLGGPDDAWSASIAKRADGYLEAFNDGSAIYDLDQTPLGRPRVARQGQPLFTLTAHTRMAWAPAEGRCLRRAELGAAMGLPTHEALACRYGTSVLQFDHLSRSCAARLIGNGMSLPCVGCVMLWCCAYVVPSVGDPASQLAGDLSRAPAFLAGLDGAPSSTNMLDSGSSLGSPARASSSLASEPSSGRSAEETSPAAPPCAPCSHGSPTDGSDTPCPTWSALGALAAVILDPAGPFADYWATTHTGRDGRQRDVFPLPLPASPCELGFEGVADCDVTHALSYGRAVIVVLNYGFGVSSVGVGRATAAQQLCTNTIGLRIERYVEELRSDVPVNRDPSAAWQTFQERGSLGSLRLLADLVECPSAAARCDPLGIVPADVAAVLSNVNAMFPAPPPGLDKFSGFTAGPRHEYLKLTSRLLQVGKLGLCRRVLGGGTVFPVVKSDGVHQREVWHGARVSEACAAPPVPRLLASPSCFAGIEIGEDQLLRVSKRDGRCFFDQLALPPTLSPYMGRPCVTAGELRGLSVEPSEYVLDGAAAAADSVPDDTAAGAATRTEGLGFAASSMQAVPRTSTARSTLGQELRGKDMVPDETVFWPCARVWGMGFAWSSFVAQETLLGVCSRAGLPNDLALAVGHPVPASSPLFFSLATDDVMIFSKEGPGVTTAAASALDSEFLKANIEKHVKKDEKDATDSVCVGVKLSGGRWWWPPAARMWSLVLAATHVCVTSTASSAALLAFLGTLQWFDLLERGKFSFYAALYRESADWNDWSPRRMPGEALRELACALILGPFWGVDMALPHLPFVAATDASSEFGIGGCVASMDCNAVSDVARFAERNGAYVTMSGVEDKPRTRSLGTPLRLAFGFERFEAIFSVRCSDEDHINLREARALLHYLKWVLRSRERHRHRVVVLIDSKVVVGGVCKGRSGSLRLNTFIRKIYCLCFAGGLRLQIIFVPTEHNPADFPSRDETIPGRRRRVGREARCPACGALPRDHPLHAPRRERGSEEMCRHRGIAGYGHVDGEWLSAATIWLVKYALHRRRRALLARCFAALRIQFAFADL